VAEAGLLGIKKAPVQLPASAEPLKESVWV
jgi:hypothetical protein